MLEDGRISHVVCIFLGILFPGGIVTDSENFNGLELREGHFDDT